MADTVGVQILQDGRKDLVFKMTGLSDGTGESLVKKITTASLTPAANTIRINKITYSISGGTNYSVTLFWEGSPNLPLANLYGHDAIESMEYGGLINNATSPTGDILLTTNNPVSGAMYTIIIEAYKEYSTSYVTL